MPSQQLLILEVCKTACCYGICTSQGISSVSSVVGCKSCVLPGGRWDSEALGSFFNPQRKVWWGGLCTDLCLFPHFIYPASHTGPVTLGPNLMPIPIPLEILFSSQFLSLFNSYCYLFLVLPLLLNCTSLFFLSFKYNTFFFHVAETWQESLKDTVKWISYPKQPQTVYFNYISNSSAKIFFGNRVTKSLKSFNWKYLNYILKRLKNWLDLGNRIAEPSPATRLAWVTSLCVRNMCCFVLYRVGSFHIGSWGEFTSEYPIWEYHCFRKLENF